MRPINAIVREIRQETPLIRTLKFDKSLDPAPGQYVMVWVRGVDEIPMSFSGPDEITVYVVGEATKSLAEMEPGYSVGLRGPIGKGFVLRGDNILLIGGGVGVAPLAFLGEQAYNVGAGVTSLLGFRSSEDIIFQSRFKRLGSVVLTTDDGSIGIKGRVSEGLRELDLREFSQIYLCGPELMMRDIINRTIDHAGKTQACINRYIKCAMGICGSCCLDPEGVRVCLEGPVMMANCLLKSEFGMYRRGPSGSKGLCRG